MKRKIVVLGGGISGYGSAILAKKKGFDRCGQQHSLQIWARLPQSSRSVSTSGA